MHDSDVHLSWMVDRVGIQRQLGQTLRCRIAGRSVHVKHIQRVRAVLQLHLPEPILLVVGRPLPRTYDVRAGNDVDGRPVLDGAELEPSQIGGMARRTARGSAGVVLPQFADRTVVLRLLQQGGYFAFIFLIVVLFIRNEIAVLVPFSGVDPIDLRRIDGQQEGRGATQYLVRFHPQFRMAEVHRQGHGAFFARCATCAGVGLVVTTY